MAMTAMAYNHVALLRSSLICLIQKKIVNAFILDYCNAFITGLAFKATKDLYLV